MSSLIPSLEIFWPMCKCKREIGTTQYSQLAEASFAEFIGNASASGAANAGVEVLMHRTVVDKLRCCELREVVPRQLIIAQSTGVHVERILPTALPSPLRTTGVLEWYGRQTSVVK